MTATIASRKPSERCINHSKYAPNIGIPGLNGAYPCGNVQFMPRPRRNPNEMSVRLVAFVSTATYKAIAAKAHEMDAPLGVALDAMFNPDVVVAPKPPRAPRMAALPHVWRLDALQRNVCGNCGGQKIAVQGQSCPGAQP